MNRMAFVSGSNGPINHQPLKYAYSDAKKIAKCLEDIRCDFNVYGPIANATPQDTIYELFEKAERCKVSDEFLCFFAGHAVSVSGKLFIYWDETDPGRLLSTAIPVDLILVALQHCKAKRKLLILDCCHAGKAIRQAKAQLRSIESVYNNFINRDYSFTMILASALFRSQEFDVLSGGFLTSQILKALTDDHDEVDTDNDGRVSISELREWILKKYELLKNDLEIESKPMFHQQGQISDIYLTHSRPIFPVTLRDNKEYIIIKVDESQKIAFCLARYVVNNTDYRKFVEESRNKPPYGEYLAYFNVETARFHESRDWRSPFYPWQSSIFNQPDLPAVCVSWLDATLYCKWKSHKQTVNFRLPTIEEWELILKRNYFEIDDSIITNNLNNIWHNRYYTSDRQTVAPASQETAHHRLSHSGIYDLIGNVWEWCQAEYDTNLEREMAKIRGGSFIDDLNYISPFQTMWLPDNKKTRRFDIGFRILAEVPYSELPEKLIPRLKYTRI